MATFQHSQRFRPDSTTRFRDSVFTLNGHRVPYDVDRCRDVEGYSNPVIHGSLNATLTAGFVQKVKRRPLAQFCYRGMQSTILGQELTINAASDGDRIVLWVGLSDCAISMHPEATF